MAECRLCGEPLDTEDIDWPDCCRGLCPECREEHMAAESDRELVLERIASPDPGIDPQERGDNLRCYLRDLRERRRYRGRTAMIHAAQAQIAALERESYASQPPQAITAHALDLSVVNEPHEPAIPAPPFTGIT